SIARLLHRLEDLAGPAVKAGLAPDASLGDAIMHGLETIASLVQRDPNQESDEVTAFLSDLPKPPRASSSVTSTSLEAVAPAPPESASPATPARAEEPSPA